MSRNNRSSLIPSNSAQLPNPKHKLLNSTVSKINNWDSQKGHHAFIQIDFTYIQHEHQCLSDWGKEDMKHFWDFYNKAQNTSWENAWKQGSNKAKDKTGLAPTNIPFDDLPCKEFSESISEEIKNFIELRVGIKRRVFGFRLKHIYYLCILDKGHKNT